MFILHTRLFILTWSVRLWDFIKYCALSKAMYKVGTLTSSRPINEHRIVRIYISCRQRLYDSHFRSLFVMSFFQYIEICTLFPLYLLGGGGGAVFFGCVHWWYTLFLLSYYLSQLQICLGQFFIPVKAWTHFVWLISY